MQFCPSFHIVQLMREGNEPQKACEMAIKMMTDRTQEWFEVAVIALNMKVNGHYVIHLYVQWLLQNVI